MELNKKFFYSKIDEIFSDKKTREVFKKQVDIYLKLNNIKINNNHKYKIGEDVNLYKGMFMRGEGSLAKLDEKKLKFISKHGFVTPDITVKYNQNQKTPLCIPVWNIQEDMLLKEYIYLYSGTTFLYTKKEDNYKYHTTLVPYKKIEEYIEKMRNEKYWMWRGEQTKEIRFMPNLAKDDSEVQMAFIMNMSGAEELVQNDIFNLNFDKQVLSNFVQKFFIDDFIYAERNDFTTNRESAIIFGIPASFIEGILVGRIYEKDINILKTIKQYFPNCYICNLDGKVIVV